MSGEVRVRPHVRRTRCMPIKPVVKEGVDDADKKDTGPEVSAPKSEDS